MYSIPIAGLHGALATGHIHICRVSPAIALPHDAFIYRVLSLAFRRAREPSSLLVDANKRGVANTPAASPNRSKRGRYQDGACMPSPAPGQRSRYGTEQIRQGSLLQSRVVHNRFTQSLLQLLLTFPVLSQRVPCPSLASPSSSRRDGHGVSPHCCCWGAGSIVANKRRKFLSQNPGCHPRLGAQGGPQQ